MSTLLVLMWFVAQIVFAFKFVTKRYEAGRWGLAFVLGLAVGFAYVVAQVGVLFQE